jgi:hypothetical protein
MASTDQVVHDSDSELDSLNSSQSANTSTTMCRRLEQPRPELDIDLNPCKSESRGRVPGLGSRTQVQVVDGSGPTKKCR